MAFALQSVFSYEKNGANKTPGKKKKRQMEDYLVLKLVVFISPEFRNYLLSNDGQLHPEVRQEI